MQGNRGGTAINRSALLAAAVLALLCALAISVAPQTAFAADGDASANTEAATAIVVDNDDEDISDVKSAAETPEKGNDSVTDSAENEAVEENGSATEAPEDGTDDTNQGALEEPTSTTEPDSSAVTDAANEPEASPETTREAFETAPASQPAAPAAKPAPAAAPQASASNAISATTQTAAVATATASTAALAPAKATKKSPKVFTVKAKVKTVGATNIVKSLTVKNARYLLLPSYANLKELRLYNGSTGGAIYVASKKAGKYQQVSATEPLDISTFKKDKAGFYRLYVKGAKSYAPFVLKAYKSAKIRTLYLVSDDPKKKGRKYIEASSDHSAEATGSMTLILADGTLVHKGKLRQIRGRGNSTWSGAKSKRPYQIKLEEKASLLDGTDENAAKTWVLLANAFDDTLMRNYIAYKTAKALGMEGAPDCEFVDLYYDGQYRGDYLLCEKVQINGGRVDITEQENKSTDGKSIEKHKTALAKNKYGMQFKYVKGVKTPKNITGGYLIELDNGFYKNERCWFKTSVGYFVLKNPEDASKTQVKYISEYMQAAINELKANKNPKKINTKSLAESYLVNEMAKNPDYMRYSSTYFYKDAGKKLYAGPVWDFDLAYGVHKTQKGVNYVTSSGWASKSASSYFTNNKQFKKSLKSVYKNELLPQAKGIIGKNKNGSVLSLKQIKAQIAKSVKMERVFHKTNRWSMVVKQFSTLNSATNYTQKWMTARIKWMTRAILK